MSRRLGDSLIFLYCPLVNNFPTPFDVDNITYECSYQHYEAGKALHFSDYKLWHDIVAGMLTSREISQRSRHVDGFNTDEWDKVAAEYMRISLEYKFQRNEQAREFIKNTGNLRLVYANGDQPFWGTGLEFQDSRNDDPSQWKGMNMIGLLLENTRDSVIQPSVNIEYHA